MGNGGNVFPQRSIQRHRHHFTHPYPKGRHIGLPLPPIHPITSASSRRPESCLGSNPSAAKPPKTECDSDSPVPLKITGDAEQILPHRCAAKPAYKTEQCGHPTWVTELALAAGLLPDENHIYQRPELSHRHRAGRGQSCRLARECDRKSRPCGNRHRGDRALADWSCR